MRIYLTHCSAKKKASLKNTKEKVTPDILYTATPTQRFMTRCKEKGVNWAIFSDKYGVWFPHVKHEWYEKDPHTVTDYEFTQLLEDFQSKLRNYEKIYFYRNRGRFHPLYKKLLKVTKLRNRITFISHLEDIS